MSVCESILGADEFLIQKWDIFLQGQRNQGITRRRTSGMLCLSACSAQAGK